MSTNSIEETIRQAAHAISKSTPISLIKKILAKDGFNQNQIDVMVRWAIKYREVSCLQQTVNKTKGI